MVCENSGIYGFMCENRGIDGFLGTSWVLITLARRNTTKKMFYTNFK